MWNQLEGKCTDSRAETDKQKPEKKKKTFLKIWKGREKACFLFVYFLVKSSDEGRGSC